MPYTLSPDLLRRGLQPLSRRPALNFTAARAALEGGRTARLAGLGIGNGKKYDLPPTVGFTLTAMNPLIDGKGRIDWDHSEWVGIDVWGDKHPYVSFEAVSDLRTPGGEAIVSPQLNLYLEDLAPQLLVEVALQAHTDDGSQPSMRVWTGNNAEQVMPVTNGKPSTIQFLAWPAGGLGGASAALQMVHQPGVPLPKSGGSWAMFELRVTPLKMA